MGSLRCVSNNSHVRDCGSARRVGRGVCGRDHRPTVGRSDCRTVGQSDSRTAPKGAGHEEGKQPRALVSRTEPIVLQAMPATLATPRSPKARLSDSRTVGRKNGDRHGQGAARRVLPLVTTSSTKQRGTGLSGSPVETKWCAFAERPPRPRRWRAVKDGRGRERASATRARTENEGGNRASKHEVGFNTGVMRWNGNQPGGSGGKRRQGRGGQSEGFGRRDLQNIGLRARSPAVLARAPSDGRTVGQSPCDDAANRAAVNSECAARSRTVGQSDGSKGRGPRRG